MKTHRLAPMLAAVLALAACDSTEKQKAAVAAAAAAQAAAKEQKAQELAKQFDTQYAQHNWVLARAHGEELVVMHPDSPVTARIKPQYEEAKLKAEQSRELQRMAALWEYQSVDVKGGQQLSAAIYSKKPVDTGVGSAQPVRLIFRDHPDWGRSSYLVLENGDFDCYGGCKVHVALDDKAPRAMAASRPKTDEAIAMFIEDERALWRMAGGGARTMTIEFPVRMGGKHSAVFEVGGLDKGKLPKW